MTWGRFGEEMRLAQFEVMEWGDYSCSTFLARLKRMLLQTMEVAWHAWFEKGLVLETPESGLEVEPEMRNRNIINECLYCYLRRREQKRRSRLALTRMHAW